MPNSYCDILLLGDIDRHIEDVSVPIYRDIGGSLYKCIVHSPVHGEVILYVHKPTSPPTPTSLSSIMVVGDGTQYKDYLSKVNIPVYHSKSSIEAIEQCLRTIASNPSIRLSKL